MKYNILIIVLLVWFAESHSQIHKNLRKIDSIQNQLKNLKLTDSALVAKKHYEIGELYRKSLLNDSAYFYLQKAEQVFKNFLIDFE